MIRTMPSPDKNIDADNKLFGDCCGNITDTLRHITDTVIPLIAASSGGTTPPIIPNPENPTS